MEDLGRARADSKIRGSIYTGGDGEGRGEREGSAVGKAIKKTTAARPRHSWDRAEFCRHPVNASFDCDLRLSSRILLSAVGVRGQ